MASVHGGPRRGSGAGIGPGVARGTLRYTPLHLSARAGGAPPWLPPNPVCPTEAPRRRSGRWRPPGRSSLILGPRARLPAHHRIRPPPWLRVRRRPWHLPGVGERELAANGSLGFYDRGFFHRLHPGLPLRALDSWGSSASLGGIGDLIKLPPILADVAIAWLVHSMVRELGGSRRASRAPRGGDALVTTRSPGRQRDLGARLVRGGLPAPRPPRALAGSSGASVDSWRRWPRSSSPSSDSCRSVGPHPSALPPHRRRRRVSTPAPVGIRPAVD